MKRSAGLNYLSLALYAFAGLGIELLYALLLEPVLYDAPYNKWTTAHMLSHWSITCITWGVIIFFLVKTAKNKYDFNIWENDGKLKPLQWIMILVCAVFMISFNYFNWNGFKFIKEFQSKGLLKFIFQYIYYAFETGLFALIIVFGQKAFEVWFKKRNIPYGGIIVALTWGIGHVLSKGSLEIGLFCTLAGFIFGIVYLLVNRDIWKTLIILYIAFAF